MKKIYIKPTTEPIQLLGQNAIMAGSPFVNIGGGMIEPGGVD